MNKEEIIKLLNLGENQEIEFKTSKNKLPKSIWETYSSFCNSKGGTIILGVKEDNKTKICTIEGIQNEKEILKDFWSIINNQEKISINILDADDVIIQKIDGRTIIVIKIPRANRRNKPVFINNNPITGTYIRLHDGDFHCEQGKIRTMMIESEDKKTRDSIVLEDYDISSINMETLNDYRAVFRLHKGDNHVWSKLSDVFIFRIRRKGRFGFI